MMEEIITLKDRYRSIIDNMLDGFAYLKAVYDENNNIIDFIHEDINSSFEKVIGYKKEGVLGKTISEIFPDAGSDLAHWIDTCGIVCSSGKSLKFEEYITTFGKWLSVSICSCEPGFVASIVHDITDKKLSEMKLIESEEKYRSVFDAEKDALLLVDTDNGDVLDINPSTCKLYGYSRKEMLEMKIYDISYNPQAVFDKIQLEASTFNISNIHKKSNGILFPVEISISKFIYKNKSVYIASIRDISEKMSLEQLKKEAAEKARLLDESLAFENLRTEFFANISHELRTPLNVILGAIQVINLYTDTGYRNINFNQFVKYIKIMRQNCFRLLRLVNNLIDITKIDAGYFEVNLENKNIVSIVEDITLSVAEYIEHKSISLIFDTENEERIMAIDSDKIERIILNLLSNAVKFTKPGGTIVVSLFERDNKFYISTKDSGIGIPPDKINLIFDRFRQVDESLTRSSEGSGIGLSLVKSLVELHKGEITVNSIYGEGTEFLVELPIKVVENSPNLSIEATNLSNSSVERIKVEFSDIYS